MTRETEFLHIVKCLEAMTSLIEDIKKDGTKVVFREQDGSEEDITDMIVPILEYTRQGIKETAEAKDTKLLK